MKSSEIEQAHKKQVISHLSLLLEDSYSSDVLLSTYQWSIPCHRLLLAAASPHLLAIFLADQKNGRTVKLPVTVTRRALRTVLRFVYMEEVATVQNDVDFLYELVHLCDFLKIMPLFRFYLHQLAELLSLINLQQLVDLSQQYKEKWTTDIILHLSDKMCNLHLRWDFLTLGVNDLRQILEHCKSDKMSMDEIALTMLSWIANEPSREQHLLELMKYIDLTLLSSDFLMCLIDRNDVIKRNSHVLQAFQHERHTRSTNRKVEHLDNAEQTLFCFYEKDETGFVAKYDINSNMWSADRIKLPFNLLTDAALVNVGHHIYFIGGYRKQIQSSSIIYNYCSMLNSLVSTSVLSFPVFSASAGVLCGAIYVINGLEWQSKQSPSPGCRVQRYCPTTGTCKEMASTNCQHSRSLMYTSNDFMYIAGLYVPQRYIERYDPFEDQWTIITSIQNSFGWFPAVFSGTQLFIASKPFGKTFNSYDLTSNEWSVENDLKAPSNLEELWAATKEGRPVVLALGGRQRLYSLDAERKTWKEKRSPSISIAGHNGKIVAMTQVGRPAERKPLYDILPSIQSVWKNSQLNDVVLVCEDKQIEAHELLLRVSSRYFQSMFSSDFREPITKRIELPTVRSQVLEIVLSFIYSGRVDFEVEFNVLLEILSVAHLMEIYLLFDLCLCRLVEQLSLENFMELFSIADVYNISGLEARLYHFLANNFYQVTKAVEFLYLTVNQLKRIMQYPHVQNKSSMKWILEAIIHWVQSDPSRTVHFGDLLSQIDLDNMTSELLPNIISQLKTQDDSLVNSVLTKELYQIIPTVDFQTCRTEVSLICLSRFQVNGQKVQIKKYNVVTKESSPPVDFPFVPACGAAAIVFDNSIYFFGGALNQQSPNVTAQVKRYCPFTDAVTSLRNLQRPVSHCAAAVVYDTIFIVGGKNSTGHPTNVVQCFVPFLGTCKEAAPTNYCHKNPLVYFFGDALIVYSTGFETNTISERYDILYDQWTVIHSSPLSIRHGGISITYEGNIYIYLKGKNVKISNSYSEFVDCDVTDAILPARNRFASRRLSKTKTGDSGDK